MHLDGHVSTTNLHWDSLMVVARASPGHFPIPNPLSRALVPSCSHPVSIGPPESLESAWGPPSSPLTATTGTPARRDMQVPTSDRG